MLRRKVSELWINRAGTLGHEVMGHALSLRRGLDSNNHQNEIPVQVENLIARTMHLKKFRTGEDHTPFHNNKYIPNYYALPY